MYFVNFLQTARKTLCICNKVRNAAILNKLEFVFFFRTTLFTSKTVINSLILPMNIKTVPYNNYVGVANI